MLFRSLGVAINAEHTVTFIGNKRGLFTGAAPAFTGAVHYRDLQVPADIYQVRQATCRKLDLTALYSLLPARSALTHKGQCGHVLAVGGDHGTAGAIAMACAAAARVGSGLISAATRPAHVSAIVGSMPEVMVHGVSNKQELEQLLPRASVLAVGPGLGQGSWAEQLMQTVDAAEGPRVLDADALKIGRAHV